jgi:6-phospho-beta-glucosidase
MAQRIEKLAPDAWLINFSNPSGIVSEALMNHTKVKTVGLCNYFVNMHAEVAKNLGREDFEYEYIGLNHLSWITSVTIDGENVLKKLAKAASAKFINIPDVDYEDELLEAIPAIPSYYLSYFYMHEKQLESSKKAEKTRGEICVEIEDSLIEKYTNPDLNDKPKELEDRGGALYSTAAVSVVDAIENDKNEYHVVSVKNNGAIPYMADDDVVEIKCTVNRKGLFPVAISDPEFPYIKGLMQAVKAYEKLTVRAVMNGSKKDAIAALMVHPLIGDYHKAKAVLNEMLQANEKYLPKGLLS